MSAFESRIISAERQTWWPAAWIKMTFGIYLFARSNPLKIRERTDQAKLTIFGPRGHKDLLCGLNRNFGAITTSMRMDSKISTSQGHHICYSSKIRQHSKGW